MDQISKFKVYKRSVTSSGVAQNINTEYSFQTYLDKAIINKTNFEKIKSLVNLKNNQNK